MSFGRVPDYALLCAKKMSLISSLGCASSRVGSEQVLTNISRLLRFMVGYPMVGSNKLYWAMKKTSSPSHCCGIARKSMGSHHDYIITKASLYSPHLWPQEQPGTRDFTTQLLSYWFWCFGWMTCYSVDIHPPAETTEGPLKNWWS